MTSAGDLREIGRTDAVMEKYHAVRRSRLSHAAMRMAVAIVDAAIAANVPNAFIDEDISINDRSVVVSWSHEGRSLSFTAAPDGTASFSKMWSDGPQSGAMNGGEYQHEMMPALWAWLT